MTKLVLALALTIATLATVPASAGPYCQEDLRIRPDQQLRLRRLSDPLRCALPGRDQWPGRLPSPLRERGGAYRQRGHDDRDFCANVSVRAADAVAGIPDLQLERRVYSSPELRGPGFFPSGAGSGLLPCSTSGCYGPPSGSCGRQAVFLRAAMCSPMPEARLPPCCCRNRRRAAFRTQRSRPCAPWAFLRTDLRSSLDPPIDQDVLLAAATIGWQISI